MTKQPQTELVYCIASHSGAPAPESIDTSMIERTNIFLHNLVKLLALIDSGHSPGMTNFACLVL